MSQRKKYFYLGLSGKIFLTLGGAWGGAPKKFDMGADRGVKKFLTWGGARGSKKILTWGGAGG